MKVILIAAVCLGFVALTAIGYGIYQFNSSQTGQALDSRSLPIIGNRIPEIEAASPIDYYIKPHQHGNVYGVLTCRITEKSLDEFILKAGLNQLSKNDIEKKPIYIDSIERFRKDGRTFLPDELTQDDRFFERPLEGANEIYGVFRQEDGVFVLYICFSDWSVSLVGDDPLE